MSDANTLGYDPVSGFFRRSDGGYYGEVNSPADAERLALAEAILGRPILDINPPRRLAAVIYEDELDLVTERDSTTDTYGVHTDHGLMTYAGAHIPTAAEARLQASNYLALARHIEARDAAAKERERVEEKAVDAKAEELRRVHHDATVFNGSPWHEIPESVQRGWRAVARHVLAGEEAG